MNNNGSNVGKFAEVKELYFPLCEYIWCGADLDNMDQLSVSMCASSLLVFIVKYLDKVVLFNYQLTISKS